MNRIFTERIYTPKITDIMGIDEYIEMEATEKAQEKFVKNLLMEFDLPDEKIASLADVTVEFVNEVKAELKVK